MRAEGVVVRLTAPRKGVPRLAKVVAPGFEHRPDDEWPTPREIQRNALSR